MRTFCLARPPRRPALHATREEEFYDASFDATWELDLFGRVRRSVQVATAEVGAVEAARFDVLVSVTSEIARNYFELRGLQNQLAVARKNAGVQTETLNMTQSLLEGGRGTAFDVSRSRSLLNLTISTIPPIEARYDAGATDFLSAERTLLEAQDRARGQRDANSHGFSGRLQSPRRRRPGEWCEAMNDYSNEH